MINFYSIRRIKKLKVELTCRDEKIRNKWRIEEAKEE